MSPALARSRQRLRLVTATGDRGTNSLQALILTPLLLLMLGAVFVIGRTVVAESAVEQAASSAARTASLARSAPQARAAAGDEARARLTQQDLDCAGVAVDVDTSGYALPTGTPATVTVTVSCTVALADLSVPGVPGSTIRRAQATSPLDTYRERGR